MVDILLYNTGPVCDTFVAPAPARTLEWNIFYIFLVTDWLHCQPDSTGKCLLLFSCCRWLILFCLHLPLAVLPCDWPTPDDHSGCSGALRNCCKALGVCASVLLYLKYLHIFTSISRVWKHSWCPDLLRVSSHHRGVFPGLPSLEDTSCFPTDCTKTPWLVIQRWKQIKVKV